MIDVGSHSGLGGQREYVTRYGTMRRMGREDIGGAVFVYL
jgi:hypothetical protein